MYTSSHNLLFFYGQRQLKLSNVLAAPYKKQLAPGGGFLSKIKEKHDPEYVIYRQQ
jgi:hypothetical protein